jgi:hypothetical protein
MINAVLYNIHQSWIYLIRVSAQIILSPDLFLFSDASNIIVKKPIAQSIQLKFILRIIHKNLNPAAIANL